MNLSTRSKRVCSSRIPQPCVRPQGRSWTALSSRACTKQLTKRSQISFGAHQLSHTSSISFSKEPQKKSPLLSPIFKLPRTAKNSLSKISASSSIVFFSSNAQTARTLQRPFHPHPHPSYHHSHLSNLPSFRLLVRFFNTKNDNVQLRRVLLTFQRPILFQSTQKVVLKQNGLDRRESQIMMTQLYSPSSTLSSVQVRNAWFSVNNEYVTWAKERRPGARSIWLVLLLALAFYFFYLYATTPIPITNRRQLVLIPAPLEAQLANYAFQTVVQNKVILPPNDPASKIVSKVCKRIMLTDHDLPRNYQWEFCVIEDTEMNAFCLPGKIVICTGLLRQIQTEGELATVMAHEIAHVMARHSSESMMVQIASAIVILVGSLALHLPFDWINLMMPLFSQAKEKEADFMGLMLMARAGYDPKSAISFWQRLGPLMDNGTHNFLSTHPPSSERMRLLKAHLPAAIDEYRKVRAHPLKFLPETQQNAKIIF